MKNYTFVLIPNDEDLKKIEDFRVKYTGSKLVDAMPPHITFKRRFSICEGYSEDDLVKILDNFSIGKIVVNFLNKSIFGDADVLVGNNDILLSKHKELLKQLSGKIITKNPDWEGNNYKIHMTLWRGNIVSTDFSNINLNDVIFDKLCLYEIDSSPERAFGKQIKCKLLV